MEEAVLGLFPITAEVKDNHLFIGGGDSGALAQEFGTPLYVFDEETLRRSCREFRQEFSSRYPETQVIYACKALLLRPLVRLLMEEGLGLGVVPGGGGQQIRLCHGAGGEGGGPGHGLPPPPPVGASFPPGLPHL